jgi:hypothetical protein
VIGPVLLLFVAASDGEGPTTEAFVRALGEALGPAARVSLNDYQQPPTDAALAQAAHARSATAAARLVWGDAGRTIASLHVYMVNGDEGHDRRLRFSPTDPPDERGRALGFVVASYVLAKIPRGPDGRALGLDVRERVWALEAFGVDAIAFKGEGSGVGGGLAGRWRAGPSWGLRLGGRVYLGSVSIAQSSTLSAELSAGVFGVLVSAGGSRGPELSVRLEGVAVYDSVTHFSTNPPDDLAPDRKGRLVPGAASLLELEWPLAESVSIHVAAGVEQVFGVTRIRLIRGDPNAKPIAEMGATRAVAELGFRARF